MRGVVACLVLLVACGACLAVDESEYIRVPGGRLIHQSCVREVPSGSHIEDRGAAGVFVNGERVSRCLHRHPSDLQATSTVRGQANGWQTWTVYEHPHNSTFSVFNGYFSVPEAPTSWGATPFSAIVYIFTGLQNDNWVPASGFPTGAPKDFEIIQPVLQYGGGSANGGGKYWGVASWYVTVDAGAFYSTEYKVQPGDQIYGVMEAQGILTWRIDSITPAGQNSSLTITRPRLINNPWAYCTLEVYNIEECSWLPPAGSVSHFTQLTLQDANGPIIPAWQSLTQQNATGTNNPCHSSFQVIDPATIDLQCQSSS